MKAHAEGAPSAGGYVGLCSVPPLVESGRVAGVGAAIFDHPWNHEQRAATIDCFSTGAGRLSRPRWFHLASKTVDATGYFRRNVEPARHVKTVCASRWRAEPAEAISGVP
jgi:hypothetical protein